MSNLLVSTTCKLGSTLGLILGFATVISACDYGYPKNDAPLQSPVTMTQKQRIEAMNAVGKLSYLEERRRYKLNDVCELRVSTGNRLSDNHSAWIPLSNTRIVRNFDKSDKTHDILLEPIKQLPPHTTSIPLVTGLNWGNAVQFMALAQYMQRDCTQLG